MKGLMGVTSGWACDRIANGWYTRFTDLTFSASLQLPAEQQSVLEQASSG